MMKRIQIETAANGYIATETTARDMCVMADDPHVFETFDSLTKWLGHQLKKPEPIMADPKKAGK